jgi:group I intron endonuclease
MYHFVYVTTNLINGKQYVGDHSTNDLNDGYLGSGKPLFNNAKKKYGKENFERKILEHFDTKQEAHNAQEEWINKLNTLQPNGYNISPTGGTRFNGMHSEDTKRKISNYISGKNHPMYGRKHKEITKKLQSKNRSGGVDFHTLETKEKMSENSKGKNKGKIPWNKGKKMDEEFKLKTKVGIKNKRSINKNYLNRYKK